MDNFTIDRFVQIIVFLTCCMVVASKASPDHSEGTHYKNFTLNITGLEEQLLDYVNNYNTLEQQLEVVNIFSSNLKDHCFTYICSSAFYCDIAVGICQSCADLCKDQRGYGVENVGESCKQNCGFYLILEELKKKFGGNNIATKGVNSVGNDATVWKTIAIIALCIIGVLLFSLLFLVFVLRNYEQEKPYIWVKAIYKFVSGKNRAPDVIRNDEAVVMLPRNLGGPDIPAGHGYEGEPIVPQNHNIENVPDNIDEVCEIEVRNAVPEHNYGGQEESNSQSLIIAQPEDDSRSEEDQASSCDGPIIAHPEGDNERSEEDVGAVGPNENGENMETQIKKIDDCS